MRCLQTWLARLAVRVFLTVAAWLSSPGCSFDQLLTVLGAQFVWQQKLAAVELVQQQHLDPLSALPLCVQDPNWRPSQAALLLQSSHVIIQQQQEVQAFQQILLTPLAAGIQNSS